jgi:DNA-directed RNA polymerase specialized sigma24 family protein
MKYSFPEKLQKAISKLNREEKRAVILHYVNEHTLELVAQKMDLSVSAARKLIRSGKSRIGDLLDNNRRTS